MIQKSLREQTIGMKAVPVFCGSSWKRKGVQPVMDAVIGISSSSSLEIIFHLQLKDLQSKQLIRKAMKF